MDKKDRGSHLAFADCIALAVCVVALIIWLKILTTKFLSFGYNDWDLAYFSQAMWNLIHGNLEVSLFDANFFANHSSFIAFFLAPLFALFPHPLTLVFLKLLSYLGGAYILYLLGREKIGAGPAILVMVLYLAYSPNIFALLYEFDFEGLAPVFLFLLFYFFKKDRFVHFSVTAFFTMLLKENMPLIIMAFGIYGLFSRKKNKLKWGVLPLGAGLLTFYLLLYSVIPYFRGGESYGYLGYYKEYGETPLAVFWSILRNPLHFISSVMTPLNREYLFKLFSPVDFLPLFSPHILFLCSPLLLQHMLSPVYTEHTIFFNYGISLAPFIFLAMLETLGFLYSRLRKPVIYLLLSLVVVLSAVSWANHYHLFQERLADKRDSLNGYRWRMIRAIPENASVVATFDGLAPLSLRENLYAFYKVYYEPYQRVFSMPENLDYAFLDLRDHWLAYQLHADEKKTVAYIQNFFQRYNWNVQQAAGDIVLLKNGKDGQGRLIEQSREPFPSTGQQGPSVNENFAMSFLQRDKVIEKGDTVVPFEFYWHSQKDIDTAYKMVFFLNKDGKVVYHYWRDIGYVVYPTSGWKAGDYIKELYWFYLPALAPGNYSLEVAFIDPRQPSKLVGLTHLDQDLLKEGKKLLLTEFNIP